MPVLDEWRLLRNGCVVGTISNHPTIDAGEFVTTSPLSTMKGKEEEIVDGCTVSTKSGSMYKLGRRGDAGEGEVEGGGVMGWGGLFNGAKNSNGAKKAAVPSVPSSVVVKPPPPRKSQSSPVVPKATTSKAASASTSAATDESEKKAMKERLRKARIQYGLTGQTVGDGKYLLSGKPRRTTSGKSMIYDAYRSDTNGLPSGPTLTVKVSPNVVAVSRESINYDKVKRGLFSGQFVTKIEFLPRAKGSAKGMDRQCALIIESGERDLKAVLVDRKGRGLEGRAMRNAASCAAQCVQAMHTSGLVWTDLKAENFVVLKDSKDMADTKGIDLESAIRRGGNPVDYSPEACPPEFAIEFLQGRGCDFVLDYSYDVWSYGMLLYELSVGQPYFSAKNPGAITKALRSPNFEANLDKVKDDKLRDLVGQCLRYDPKKRPGVPQILLHPFFFTTGIGPFSF